jgi:hypothetical protein
MSVSEGASLRGAARAARCRSTRPGASADMSACSAGTSRRPLLPLMLVSRRPVLAWRASGLARSTAKGGAHPGW